MNNVDEDEWIVGRNKYIQGMDGTQVTILLNQPNLVSSRHHGAGLCISSFAAFHQQLQVPRERGWDLVQ